MIMRGQTWNSKGMVAKAIVTPTFREEACTSPYSLCSTFQVSLLTFHCFQIISFRLHMES